MPKGRKLTRTVQTDNLMGEGTFIKYVEPSSAEMEEYRFKILDIQSLILNAEREKTIDTDAFKSLVKKNKQFQAEFMAKCIIEWNWVVDEEGILPMEQPYGNPDVFLNELRDSEWQFLNGLFQITPEKKDS